MLTKDSGIDAAREYAAALVAREDRDRYLTALFAPVPQRGALLSLYAFNVEVARIRESVSETLIGRVRLQWWRDLIARIYSDGTYPAGNPVVEGLAHVIAAHRLSRAHFDALIDARERDLDDTAPADVAALEAYAAGTSAALNELGLEILGVSDDVSRTAARHVGIAWSLTGLLRAILFHARTNRFTLPQDLLDGAGLTPHDLQEAANAAKIAGVVDQVAGLARGHLARARELRKDVDPSALPVLLTATLADRYLAGLERRRNDVFDPRHALQRQSVARLMWNAWRKRY